LVKNVENTDIGKSFVSVVKTGPMPIDKESPPALSLKMIVECEGSPLISLMDSVLLEFETAKAKDSFRGNVGVGSWFSVIKQAYAEFVPEGRLVWVELDGVPFKFWSGPTFKRIAAKWGELLDVDDYDESNLHSKRFAFFLCFKDKHSEDPLVYTVVDKENIELARKDYEENERDDNSFVNLIDGKDNSESVNKNSESKHSGQSKYSVLPRTGGSILNLMEEVMKVGQTMGYNMDGCIKDITEIIESQGEFGGLDLMIVVVYAPQEAKEKRMLWDYFAHVLNQWVGKLVMMGDFNDVRYKLDRYGSNFNAHDAEIFNFFIYNAGLDEVPLGGSAYTCCGFDKLVGILGTWLLLQEKNASENFMGKLNFLKESIRKRLSIYRSNSEVNNIQASEIAQKAKIKWAIDGDENVKFFHGMLNKKRNQSNIRGIMVNGMWVDDPVQVTREFFEHFQGRFDKPSVNRACIDTHFPVSLSIDQKEDMERRISKEEVKRAVWDCGVDKSPGPNGFSFSFYHHFWPVIEKDVFEAVNYFFMYGEIPDRCNSNFIALIPKILDANMVKDFRPISLIGSLYKIIAKILANRLVGVLGDLVNEVQSAFVADRQILDGPFILDEVLQWCRRKKKHALIFKVDFEKAFDSVRWDFVDDVLNKFGFGERWRTWIQSCLRSSRGSILVNGSPTEALQFFRGLKQ
ncbi:RNA-directed DNA polymerase, eukaryota, partial [Tanacetum coccineum]